MEYIYLLNGLLKQSGIIDTKIQGNMKVNSISRYVDDITISLCTGPVYTENCTCSHRYFPVACSLLTQSMMCAL